MATKAEAEKTEASDAKAPKSKSKDDKRVQTPEHKQLIADGREQAKIVGRYLDGLVVTKKKRGRQVTPEQLQERLAKIEGDLETAKPIDRLNLLQQRKSLQAKLDTKAPDVDMEALTAEFVKVGKGYAERKEIDRATFIEVGVPAEVLKLAGI